MPMLSRPRFSHYFASFSILVLTLFIYFGNEPSLSSTTNNSNSNNNLSVRRPPLRSFDFKHALVEKGANQQHPSSSSRHGLDPANIGAGAGSGSRLASAAFDSLSRFRIGRMKDVDLSSLRLINKDRRPSSSSSALVNHPILSHLKDFSDRFRSTTKPSGKQNVEGGGGGGGGGGDPRPKRWTTNEEADRAFCGISPCKVVVPGFIAQQESKAQNHVHQLSLFASLLNRRLVLPNVKKSRMGMCYSHPWETFYDQNALNLAAGNDSGLQQDKLERWLQGRPEPPRVQRVIIGNSAGPEGGFVGVDSEAEERNDQKDCLGEKARGNVRFGGWEDALVMRDSVLAAPRSSLRPRGKDDPPTLHQQIVEMLGNSSSFEIFDSEYPHPASSTPDILLVNWLSHRPLFSSPLSLASSPSSSSPPNPLNPKLKEQLSASYLEEISRSSPPLDLPPPSALTLPLAYAPHLVSLANKISEPIHPFLSIHWRTERVPASRLLSCSKTLLNKLEDVLASSQGSGIRTVYLATDLPLQPDDLFKSSTYRASSAGDEDDSARNEAVKLLKIAFGRWGKMGRRGVRLTGLREEMWVRGVGEKEKSLAGMDSGVAGILDKLIASHAEMFLSAEDPCGLQSSFTDQIVSLRNRTLASSLSSELVLPDDSLFSSGWLPSSSPSSTRLRNSVDYFGGDDASSREREPEEQWILE